MPTGVIVKLLQHLFWCAQLVPYAANIVSPFASITVVADWRRTRAMSTALILTLAMCLAIASCSAEDLPQSTPLGSDTSGQNAFGTTDQIVVDAAGEGIFIDRRLLGINLPAWIGPGVLADQDFRRGALDSGTTLVRMPGGSWSSVYDWLGCEQGDSATCFWTWAARPTDFIDFLRGTGLEGMWTVSLNDTAEKSAAAVAFFNGEVDDATEIGVDRLGVDWGEVGDWAQLRAANGNTAPIGISLWEVGNEVYGARPSTGGPECADFGWEEVWTCDGTEYVEGIASQDGALAIRAAMLAVDPDIKVGFVGVTDPASWGNWGNEVIDAARGSLDFYSVHHYPFTQSPSGNRALGEPVESWPSIIEQARRNLPASVPVAITEYNLVSFEAGDTDQTMTRAMNAFYLADSIGQLAARGVAIANWWNLANGVTQSGTDYGLISVEDDSYRRSPAFEAFTMWGRAGTSLLDPPTRTDDLRVYPTRHNDGRLTILAINLGTEQITTDLVIQGLDRTIEFETTIETISTDNLNAQELTMKPARGLGTPHEPINLNIGPWSIHLIEIQPASP